MLVHSLLFFFVLNFGFFFFGSNVDVVNCNSWKLGFVFGFFLIERPENKKKLGSFTFVSSVPLLLLLFVGSDFVRVNKC